MKTAQAGRVKSSLQLCFSIKGKVIPGLVIIDEWIKLKNFKSCLTIFRVRFVMLFRNTHQKVKQEMLSCDRCSKVFPKQEFLRSHLATQHPQENV
jgi:hypothetical protein